MMMVKQPLGWLRERREEVDVSSFGEGEKAGWYCVSY